MNKLRRKATLREILEALRSPNNPHRVLSQSIKGMLSELISRYNIKADEQRECSDEFPGNWYGLQEIGFAIIDEDTRTTKTTYRMDEDLCRVLRVPEGATCHGIWVEGKLISAGYDNPHHSVTELGEIERLLTTVMSAERMKNV